MLSTTLRIARPGKDGESRTLLVRVSKRRKRPLKLGAGLPKPATKPRPNRAEKVRSYLALLEGTDEDSLRSADEEPGKIGFAHRERRTARNLPGIIV
jgi:hypothetical protein